MKIKLEQGLMALRKHILKDLHTTDFDKDPFGYCTYLFFLLKNNIEEKNIDNLVDWMNTYIQEVICNKKISKSADAEITTALFGLYTLEKYERLTVSVSIKQITEVLDAYVDEEGTFFKRNLVYTLAIALSLFPRKSKFAKWNKLRKAIEKEYSSSNLLCDPKNQLYYTLLLEEEQNKSELQKVAQYASEAIIKNNINTHDKAYYFWTAWRNRKYLKKELNVIKNKMANTIENFLNNLEIAEDPESKIVKSLFFDMSLEFSDRTVLLSYDEYHEPNIFAKIGGFVLGGLLLMVAISLIYESVKFGLLNYADVTLISVKSFNSFCIDASKLLGCIVLLLLETYMLWIGGVIIWEVPIKNRYQKHELHPILVDRSKLFFKWAILIVAGQLVITPFL